MLLLAVGALAIPFVSSSFFGKGISEQMQGSTSFGMTRRVLTLSLCQERALRRALVSESNMPTTPLVVPTRIFLPAVTNVATWNVTSSSVHVMVELMIHYLFEKKQVTICLCFSLSLSLLYTHTHTQSLSLFFIHTHTHTHSLSLSLAHTHTLHFNNQHTQHAQVLCTLIKHSKAYLFLAGQHSSKCISVF